jgi:hypothetical protein
MTSQSIRGWAAAGAVAGVFAISGCGSGETTVSATPTRAASATSTPEQAAAIPERLTGTWKRTMTPRDWKPVGAGYPLGTWRLDVNRKGELAVTLPRTHKVDFTAAIEVSGARMTIDGVPICPGKRSRYTWSATARKLELTVVSDDGCAAGATLFGGTWRRSR